MKNLLNNLSRETLIKIIVDLQEEHHDLLSEYRYTFDQARDMQGTISELSSQLESANRSNTLTVSDNEKYILYYGNILDTTTGEVVIEQQELLELKMQYKVEEHNEDYLDWHEYADIPF